MPPHHHQGKQPPTLHYEVVPIGFQPGQFVHILNDLPSTYEKRYTTAVTITNPETTTQTEHDNVVLDHYYDPNFDQDQFKLTLQTFSLRFPISQTGKLVPLLQNLNLSSNWRCRAVQEDESHIVLTKTQSELKQKTEATSPPPTHRRYLLCSGILPEALGDEALVIAEGDQDTTTMLDDIKQTSYSQQTLIKCFPEKLQEAFQTLDIEIVPQSVTFNYNYFYYEEIMTALMKQNMTIPTGFTPTGHIAHFNLRQDQLPWQYIAGRVLSDKIHGITTVINKVGMINNVFRNFQAEILYGEDNFVTEIKENGFTFLLDFSQVYWNSRLLTEHGRLSKFIHKWWRQGNNDKKKTDDAAIATTTTLSPQHNPTPTYALDLFGGIGPFVIPLVKTQGALSPQHQQFGYSNGNTAKCVVWGNDINPKSSLYMWKNAVKNRFVTTAEQLQKDAKRAAMKKKNIAASASKNGAEGKEKKEEVVEKVTDNKTTDDEPNLRVFNSCGRELMSLIAKQQMSSLIINKYKKSTPANKDELDTTKKSQIDNTKSLPFFQHAIMNLPASAVQFLDMYVGLYTEKTMKFVPEVETLVVGENNVISVGLDIQKEENSTTKIINLTSHSQLDQKDQEEQDNYLTKLTTTHILPSHFDESYEKIVDDMSINDSNHHWSIIQQIYQNKQHKTISINNPLTTSNNLYIPSILDIQTTIMKRQTTESSIEPKKNSADENNLIVHCHCFVRDAIDPFGESLNLVEGYLGFQLSPHSPSLLTPVTKGVKMDYNNQLPIITDDNIQTVNDNLITALNTNKSLFPTTPSPLDLNTRQQNYLTSTAFATWRDNLHPHSPSTMGNSKEIARTYDELLLMEYCLQKDGLFIHHVRNVAPGKEMMCVSFVVPDYVLFYSPEYYNRLGQLMTKQLKWGDEQETNPTSFAPLISYLSQTDNTPSILSEYDQTPVDNVDIQLWLQQSQFKGNITPTSFLQRRIESILNPSSDNTPQKGESRADDLSLDGLSKLPNEKTRAHESPVIKPADETVVSQMNKKTRF